MARRAPARTAAKKKRTLTVQQEAFVHEYDANGGNGVRAYMASHPECESYSAAGVGAFHYLRNPKIRTVIDALAEARWKRLAMTGDEAVARIAQDARADIRELFDDDGNLLPVRHWPDSVAQSVKAIRPGKDGYTVVLNDSLAARRLIAEQTGKLKSTAGAVGDLARILAGDFEEGE